MPSSSSSLVPAVASNPTAMYFPHSDKPVMRRLIIRNVTHSPYAIKLVETAPSVTKLEASKMLLRPGMFATMNITVDPSTVNLLDFASHKIHIYARPVTVGNFAGIKDWVADDGMGTVKQRVVTLTVRISREYSARDTVLDIPGDAAAVEATIESSADAALDADAKTANGIDGDTTTAAPIEAADGIALLRATNETVGGWSVAAVAEWLGLKVAA